VARYLLLDPNGPSVTVGILSPLRSTNGAVGFGPLSTAYTPRHYKYSSVLCFFLMCSVYFPLLFVSVYCIASVTGRPVVGSRL